MSRIRQIPEAVLKRKAIVYVRQSSQSQVQTNLESQRRQYDLVDVACAQPAIVSLTRRQDIAQPAQIHLRLIP